MRKRFIVCDPQGRQVDDYLYESRRKAMDGPWQQAIVEAGYTVKRINLELIRDENGSMVWKQKGATYE